MSFEKVNPSHPDKVADRIAGAIVDLAYKKQDNPKIAVEVLIGHGRCYIIAETSVHIEEEAAMAIVDYIMGDGMTFTDYKEVPQNAHLAENQSKEIRCGDNGIFKGVPTSQEESTLASITKSLYQRWSTDGKFIYDGPGKVFIACQSNAASDEIERKIAWELGDYGLDGTNIIVNPLGEWTGGTNVDTGATNRKLGSDMGRAVTGGGLHGKDLSKADVSVNIACHILSQATGMEINALCAIGDKEITFKREDGDETTFSYKDVVEMARSYINDLGGFEKLAEWGLI